MSASATAVLLSEPQALRVIDTCHSTWLFDEDHHRFRRILRRGAVGYVPTGWRAYERLVDEPSCETFVVVLDRQGTRVLRGRRCGSGCRCQGGGEATGLQDAPSPVVPLRASGRTSVGRAVRAAVGKAVHAAGSGVVEAPVIPLPLPVPNGARARSRARFGHAVPGAWYVAPDGDALVTARSAERQASLEPLDPRQEVGGAQAEGLPGGADERRSRLRSVVDRHLEEAEHAVAGEHVHVAVPG